MSITFGIECFRSDNCPLLGDLKVSPSDFVVREISIDGKIAGIHHVGESLGVSDNKKQKIQCEVKIEDNPVASVKLTNQNGVSNTHTMKPNLLADDVKVEQELVCEISAMKTDLSTDDVKVKQEPVCEIPAIKTNLPADDVKVEQELVCEISAIKTNLPEDDVKVKQEPVCEIPAIKTNLPADDVKVKQELFCEIPAIKTNLPADEAPVEQQDINWADIHKAPKSHLVSMIGEETFKKVSTMDSTDPLVETNVGCFNDKVDRSILHQCIRFSFPYIMSASCKVGNNTEVWCKADPVYLNLLSNGVAAEAAKRLLVFAHCRLLTGNLHDTSEEFMLDVTSFDRHKRKILHHTIHNKFGKFMESKTLFRYNKHWISVRFKERRDQPKASKRKREAPMDICCVTLAKENMEHLHAVRELSRAVEVHISKISHAGMKDKKAKTFQFISLKGTTVKKIEKVAELSYKGWSVSKPTVIAKELQLGDLSGNHFQIVVRNVREAEPDFIVLLPIDSRSESLQETIRHSINNVQCNGFINYYGEQRFGLDLTSVIIGMMMLQEKFKEAVETMFKLSPNELETSNDNPFVKAKEMFANTGPSKKMLHLIPHHKTRECLVMKGINKYSYDEEGCVKGFLYLPYESRLFYVHSYCSYVWNQAVSWRIQHHGCRILPGDLVLSDDVTPNDVKFVSRDDIDQGVYSFKDVVFPLPGSMVRLPDNETKDFYLDTLKSAGLELKDFQSKQLRLYNIPGTYRKVIEVVKELQWNLTTNDGDTNDLELNFSLSPSTYATMAIREIMHTISA